jgi:hypothetical protein
MSEASTDLCDKQDDMTRKPWHAPVMEVLPVSKSESFNTTASDGIISANS